MKILELYEHQTLELNRSDLVARLVAADGDEAGAERVAASLVARANGLLREVRPLGENQPAAILAEKAGGENFVLKLASTFFVGMDWIVPGVLAVRVRPKIDNLREDRTTEIDVLGMLEEILEEAFDAEHYNGLLFTSSDTTPINGGGDYVGLRYFLVAEYLALLHRIVRKGLRRQYVAQQEVFHRKLRGRIVWSKTFSKPSANFADRIVCEPVGFTKDTEENRYLKAGLRAADIMMGKLPSSFKSKGLRGIFRLLIAAFDEVSDTDESTRPRFVKANPVFRDYAAAIAMTKRIFEMDSVGYAQNRTTATVPPHWLYMPKLFELYVYAKFRAAIKKDDRLIYHLTVEKQELDYLCDIKALLNTPVGGRYAVVDAKYKMLYDEGRIDRDDARQLSGYARFAPVHKELHEWGMPEAASASLLPCLIIHPTLDDAYETRLDFSRIVGNEKWLGFSTLAIRLPEVVEPNFAASDSSTAEAVKVCLNNVEQPGQPVASSG